MSSATKALEQLSANLAELSDVPSRAARGAAARINVALQEQFDGEHDPDGRPWAKLLPQTVRRKGGDSRILQRTGEMREGTYARPSQGSGIEISSVEYASFHQTGTKHMTKRPVLPAQDGLPDEWTEIVDDEVAKAFARRRA